MTGYVPTTDEVRVGWIVGETRDGHGVDHEGLVPKVAAEFDRWLERERAVARREGQAEAWADAVASAYLHETEHFISIKHDPNPYLDD